VRVKKQNTTKSKSTNDVYLLDVLLLVLMPVIATLVTLRLDINFVTASLLFFGLPAAYLSVRTCQYVPRAALFSLVATCGCIVINYFAIRDGSWYVPETAFGFRFPGDMVLDDMLWAFLLIYLVVMFYEHFFDKGRHAVAGKSLVYFVFLVLGLLLLFTMLQALVPSALHYFYLKAGVILLLLPVVALSVAFPKYLSIALKTFPYFFTLSLLMLLAGLHNGYWVYPGEHFIGWVSVFGHKVPVEEILFWIALFSTAVIMYFEFFDDNRARLPQRLARKLHLRH